MSSFCFCVPFFIKKLMKVAIRQGSVFHFVEDNEVIRIEAHNGQAIIYLINGETYKVTTNLTKMVDNLSNSFLKIHRSHIVNLNHASTIIDSGKAKLMMNDSTVLPISKSLKTKVVECLESMKDY